MVDSDPAVHADDDLIVGYRTEGDFPLYGNDDDRADDIAKWYTSCPFMET